jgi:hypothetical protein
MRQKVEPGYNVLLGLLLDCRLALRESRQTFTNDVAVHTRVPLGLVPEEIVEALCIRLRVALRDAQRRI